MNLNQNRLVDIFLELVAINAVAKSEKPVADYIRKFLSNLQISVMEDATGRIIDGNSGNIIAKIYNDGKKGPIPFALVAHMDTVKPTTGIKPLIMDGRITSDGNTILGADNRAGIALILYLIENLHSNKLSHQPFEIIFTVGEETGLYGSTNLDMDMVESRNAYILDSSADPGYFVCAAPGAVDFRIRFLGKGSHAAVNPDKGINALSMAAALINRFSVGKVDEDTTINFGRISGGEANNVVPPLVELTGEIRSFNKNKIEHYSNRLSIQLKNISTEFGGNFELELEQAFPGFVLNKRSEAIKNLNSCLEKTGLTPMPIRYHGGSDANMLNNKGITAIDLGIGAKNPHSTEEYIMIRDLLAIEKLIHHLVLIQ
ncbi:MAG: M20/M25/M40 family metallo-hydrolase [Calditrichaeota bacterium]|nr:M20/M25/M40 family metallo-hydrolase [Calditrichota bacterium]RQV99048.1 MAG: M20/M25/M40 family metallo-hydrolase [Calditrichota bacterium]